VASLENFDHNPAVNFGAVFSNTKFPPSSFEQPQRYQASKGFLRLPTKNLFVPPVKMGFTDLVSDAGLSGG
jgi:hypothetical protein